jgi:hypothetical protein
MWAGDRLVGDDHVRSYLDLSSMKAKMTLSTSRLLTSKLVGMNSFGPGSLSWGMSLGPCS